MTSCRSFLNTLCATVAVALCVATTPAASAATETPDIVGGAVATTTTLPWLAQISVILPDDAGISCSGTVVAPRLILSAGHCVENLATGTQYTPSQFVVTTGSGNVDSASAQQSAVTRVIPDPSFAAPSQNNDAALLVLGTPTRALAIQLATPAQTANPAGPQAAGTPALVAGWGITNPISSTAPRLLHSAPTVVQSDATCAQVFGTTFDPSSQLCALNTANETTSACSGDSGGPLITTVDGVTVEVGLAIYVAQGCATTLPDVFTRTDILAPWVATQAAALTRPAARHAQARRRMRTQSRTRTKPRSQLRGKSVVSEAGLWLRFRVQTGWKRKGPTVAEASTAPPSPSLLEASVQVGSWERNGSRLTRPPAG